MTATQDARRTALTAYAVTSARIALETLAARKDDEIIRTDTFTFRPDSASGRGPSLARIISMMAQALFGAGFVSDGNCHKSTQTNPIFEEVVIPVLFRPFFTALVTALDAPGGYIRTAEKVVTTSARQVIKEHGTGNRTVYNMTNKASRIQMETAGAELAADIAAQFPADDPQIITIREVIAATTAELTRHSAGKLSYLHTPTDRYAVKQELATASA